MTTCAKCGSFLAPRVAQCPHCGTPVGTAVPLAVARPTEKRALWLGLALGFGLALLASLATSNRVRTSWLVALLLLAVPLVLLIASHLPGTAERLRTQSSRRFWRGAVVGLAVSYLLVGGVAIARACAAFMDGV